MVIKKILISIIKKGLIILLSFIIILISYISFVYISFQLGYYEPYKFLLDGIKDGCG